jgi:uncharacterized protein (DUF362 family)
MCADMTGGPVDNHRAVVVRGDRPGVDLLTDALDRVGVWDRLTAVTGRRSPKTLRVSLLVGMSAYDGTAAAVDPTLVEALLDELAARGYLRLTVVPSRFGPDPWLDPSTARAAAQVLGYSGRTATGTPYDIADIDDVDDVAAEEPDAEVSALVPAAWRDAAFRINMASNATHPEWGFALSITNVLGMLAAADRYYDYAVRRDAGEVAGAVLASYPTHCTVIDAVTSAHGVAAGSTLQTDTVIAATDGVLADVVGAALMGLDPVVSPVVARVLETPGLPAHYEIDGDLTPYAGFRNTHAAMRELLADAPRGVTRVLVPALTPVDRRRTTFTDPTLDALNRLLAGMAQSADRDPTSMAGLLGVCGWAIMVGNSVESWQTMFAKSRPRRRQTQLGLDLGSYTEADYDAVVDYIEPLEAIVDAVPADAWGMRRCALEGSVLFRCSRMLAAPYNDFIARVDISESIRLMNDYLGGATVPVARDEEGRVLRQAERNVYLPQPNYLALFGGQPIDVCKLESIRYGADEQKICWRTVRSPNGSAAYDDGSVLFRAVDGGARTEIVIHARQQFTLPLFWQVVDLDRMPEVKDPLVADAYRTFFLATLDNFEARYEGRDFEIGRPWDPDGEELPTVTVTRLARMAKDGIGEVGERFGVRADDEADGLLDVDGFRHFVAGPPEQTVRDRSVRWWDQLRGKVAPVADEVARDLREVVARESGMWSGR